jgi:D-tyrosyl-tRNA(Tyr) deacylase
MIALIQRVTHAWVDVDEQRIAEIGPGLLALVGVEKTDGPENAEKLLRRLLNYRIFPDASGKMNRSLPEVEGELLLVPQFTLVADTRKGNRPSFSSGADPATGRHLFNTLLQQARSHYPGRVYSGRFGADMQVGLVNDGPVTFWLQH